MEKVDIDFIFGASWPENGELLVKYLTAPDPDTLLQSSAIPAGYIARIQFRPHPNSTEVLLELLPDIDYVAGTFPWRLDAAQTAALPSLSHWGLQLESPDGLTVVPLAGGRVNGHLKAVRRP